MAERANVANTDALDNFRSSLVNYIEKAGTALHEVTEDVRRTRQWLQTDRLPYWSQEIKARRRRFEDANQRLFGAELSTMKESSTLEKREVLKCRDSLHEAEDRLRQVKGWLRRFDSDVEPIARKLERLQRLISDDLPKGVTTLSNAMRAIDSYQRMSAPSLEGVGTPPPESTETTEGGTTA